MSRWDAKTNIKFIKEYEKQTSLWDPRHPMYKNKYARDEAYKRIAQVMDIEMTTKEVVSKIRTLRNTYNNEVLKMKKSEATGMGPDQIYHSKISWISSLDFLKDIECFTRKSIDLMHEVLINDLSNDTTTVEIPPTPSPPPSPPPKKKTPHPIIQPELITALSSGNEFEIFGKNVAVQLQSLPLEMALETQELLLSILRQQRIKALRLQSNYNDVGSSSKMKSESL